MAMAGTSEDDFAALASKLRALETTVHNLAAEPEVAPGVSAMWTLGTAGLVFFMQAGFALLESGTCRGKNVLSILTKNQMDTVMGVVMWYLFGWGLAFGDATSTQGLAGASGFFGGGVFSGDAVSETAAVYHFQGMFCATAATIVSGGIAERATLRGYILFTLLLSGFIYPIIACWAWNEDGWLRKLGFHDLAGSGVVHLTGGIGALCGAWLLGPRAGRFTSGDTHEFAPHSVPFTVLGTLILWFGWFGFNTGCLDVETAAGARTVALVVINTSAAASAGSLLAAAVRYRQIARWDVSFVCNGALVGLVSITGSADIVSPAGAFVIGAIGSLIFAGLFFALDALQVDDPVGAVPVHLGGGLWGVIAASLFSRNSTVLGEPMEPPKPLVQLTGALAIASFSFCSCFVVFWLLSRVGISKTSSIQQMRGLDCTYATAAYNAGKPARYRAMISHVKSSHGATARWFQLELGRHAGGKSAIFLDSDDLVNLNTLLATVRDRVDVLVVLATKDIWSRPWCAGEISVASASGVPVVLIRMDDGPLDFQRIAGEVRSSISKQQLETLAPFGIDYEDIQRAYAKLQDAEQIPFSTEDLARLPGKFEAIARLADLRPRFGRRAMAMWRQPRPEPERPGPERVGAAGVIVVGDEGAQCFGGLLKKSKPTLLIMCEVDNVEAVAAMHICATALSTIQQEKAEDGDIVCCSARSEGQIMQLIHAGATIILILSRNVLSDGLVQKACLARLAQLRPLHRADSSSGKEVDDTESEKFIVLVHADRLQFDFPDKDFYEDLVHNSQTPVAESCDFSSSFPSAAPPSPPGASPEADLGRRETAAALVHFYTAMFGQIALTISTHGSWRTIQHQCFWIYERASSASAHSAGLAFGDNRSTGSGFSWRSGAASAASAASLPRLLEETSAGKRAEPEMREAAGEPNVHAAGGMNHACPA